MTLGFSTGCIWRHYEDNLLGAIDCIQATGANAIELSMSSKKRSKQLQKLTPNDLVPFVYVSIHGPSLDAADAREILDDIQDFHDRFPIHGVVFHPDTVMDFCILDEYSFPCIFENMDSRKSYGTTCVDMQEVFDKDASYGFCLDVNHVYTLDQTMQGAHDFMDMFSSRLQEVHLSGARPDETGFLYHRPIFETKQEVILHATPENTPIIIESDFSEYAKQDLAHGLREEFEYIRSKLNHGCHLGK